ncbi:MAG TPA: aminoglycoside phosphotransferase family protein, partial [Bryobacteraceae bacterium]|nr:aminoglycoside phosphotransferase family protein [Bryobacteraceae bacterium]
RWLAIIILSLIAKPSVELTVRSTPQYLAQRGFAYESLRVTELTGGVSNIVLLVEHAGGRFVLKQALPRLRVEQEWFSDMRRIFQESAALRLLAPKLPPGSIPSVLFEDPENYAFAMSAAPDGSESWKACLLRNEPNSRIAEHVGEILGTLMRESWNSQELAAQFGDLTIFEELRLDPYYGRMIALYPDLAAHFEALIEDCRTRRVCLVHGDWSPKNILVHDSHAIAIDFEVIHFGDPSFDAAFLLNHLLLKTFYGIKAAPLLAEVFWTSLRGTMPDAPWFEKATLAHLGGLLLARMDGKSPAEYIRDPKLKQRIRLFARELIVNPPASIAEVWSRYAAKH